MADEQPVLREVPVRSVLPAEEVRWKALVRAHQCLGFRKPMLADDLG